MANIKRFFSFKKKKKDVNVRVENKNYRKKANDFDDWCKKHKKLVLKKNDEHITKACWYNELLMIIENKGDIKVFLDKKNRELRYEFIDDVTPMHMEVLANCFEEINKYENVILMCERIVEEFLEFEKSVVKLLKRYPKKREEDIKLFLSDYVNFGCFKRENVVKLVFEVEGFWNNVFYFIKKFIVNRTLYGLIKKYSENNLYLRTFELYKMPYGLDFWFMFNSKLGVICNLDFDSSVKWSNRIDRAIVKLKKNIASEEKLAEKKKLIIEDIEKSFDSSLLVEKEYDIVVDYIKRNFNM